MALRPFAPPERLPPIARVPGSPAGRVEISGFPSPLVLSEHEVRVDACGAGLDEPAAPGVAPPLKRTGNRVWDAALTLCRHLRDRRDVPSGAVDLGAGTGVAGLAAHALGVGSVWLTDLADQLPLLQANAAGKLGVEVAELDWRRPDQAQALASRLDGVPKLWVLACEVLYPRGLQGPDGLVDDFFDTLLTLLVRFAGPCVTLLVYQERSNMVTMAMQGRIAKDGFIAKVVGADGAVVILELSLPPAAKAAAATRKSRADVEAAAITAQWADALAPQLADDGGGREAAERFARASPAGPAAGLVLWHVGRALGEYAPLRCRCLRVLAAPTRENEGDPLQRRIVAAVQLQMETLDAHFAGLHLPADVQVAHTAVGDLQRAVRNLHTTLCGISADASFPFVECEISCRLSIDGHDVTEMLPRASVARASLSGAIAPGADGDLIGATPPAAPAASPPASETSLADALAALYAAVVQEATAAGDGWVLQRAEGLLEALDDGGAATSRAWLQAWIEGPPSCEAAGVDPTSGVIGLARRVELSAGLQELLDKGWGADGSQRRL